MSAIGWVLVTVVIGMPVVLLLVGCLAGLFSDPRGWDERNDSRQGGGNT